MKLPTLTTLLFCSFVFSKQSKNVDALTRELLSIEADKEIQFIPTNSQAIDEFVEYGLKIIFFGANHCQFTQRFTPKFLETVKILEKENISNSALYYFDMRKVECSINFEVCEKLKIVGFPTTLIYVNGELKEEYPFEDEIRPFVKYIKKEIKEFKLAGLKNEIKYQVNSTLHQAPPPIIDYVDTDAVNQNSANNKLVEQVTIDKQIVDEQKGNEENKIMTERLNKAFFSVESTHAETENHVHHVDEQEEFSIYTLKTGKV
ncbi:hypothetical protein HK099_004750 [Clydaea vesicula]|uniref:Thioredoxin domain-containing protein n=1 Tax=Clydaea vesicula TaxID=447962 RepID=A0AAD5U0B6_9FUNG|nr:hypothetical protein HK099_004750 [Clydaea vesicula]KAJ3378437.1 hypothetical protein HDU92_007388 [Lobulomyces angularis]